MFPRRRQVSVLSQWQNFLMGHHGFPAPAACVYVLVTPAVMGRQLTIFHFTQFTQCLVHLGDKGNPTKVQITSELCKHNLKIHLLLRYSQTPFQNYSLPAFLPSLGRKTGLMMSAWIIQPRQVESRMESEALLPQIKHRSQTLAQIGGMPWGHRTQEHGKTWGKNFRKNTRFSSSIRRFLLPQEPLATSMSWGHTTKDQLGLDVSSTEGTGWLSERGWT